MQIGQIPVKMFLVELGGFLYAKLKSPEMHLQ
jgi:hypothetical protein